MPAVVPTTAYGATSDWRCDADAVEGTILGRAVSAVGANKGGASCVTRAAKGTLAGLPVGGGALVAGTRGGEEVLAAGGAADLALRAVPELALRLPLPALPAELGAVTVPLTTGAVAGATETVDGVAGDVTGTVVSAAGTASAVTEPGGGVAGQTTGAAGGAVSTAGGAVGGVVGTAGGTGAVRDTVAGLPQQITVDLRPALQALLPDWELPSADLVRVRSAMAYAGGRCTTGRPELGGSARVAGLTVLGQDVPTDRAVERALTLRPAQTIDAATADLARIGLPAGLSLHDPVAGPVLRSALRTVLAGLPAITVPAAVGRVSVTPGEQTRDGASLVQRALRLQVSVVGRSVADLSIGRAAVAAEDVDCDQDANALVLDCQERKLVLTDVTERGGRVELVGVADRALAGRTVALRFRATGRRVASARIAADGAFSAVAPLPARRLRATNRARYRAVLQREKSLDLKLRRRMRVERTTAHGRTATIRGRVLGPRSSARIVVKRRVACGEWRRVGTVRPAADGTFVARVPAPAGEAAAVYRLKTKVLEDNGSGRVFPTFTLPVGVNLR